MHPRAPLRRTLVAGVATLSVALGGVLAVPARVLGGSAVQTVTFNPLLAAPVGSAISLKATASSGLSVTFSSQTPAICSMSGATASFNAVGTCKVKASQSGNATWAPASVTRDVAVAGRSYRAIAAASLNGIKRTDGTIRIGDDLSIEISAPDSDVTSCMVSMSMGAAGTMRASGVLQDDGSCTFDLVLPALPVPVGPEIFRDYPDLCIRDISVTFADGTATSSEGLATRRVMALGDRLKPGGNNCEPGSQRQAEEVLDFGFVGLGTPRPFTSSPKMLSWNPSDWGTGYVPLTFNTPWEVEFPDWVTACAGPHLNGPWVSMSLHSHVPGCQPWSLTLPGVLPATLPDHVPLVDWEAELLFAYTDDRGLGGVTHAGVNVPFDSSDGVFASSLPGIFPVDVAVTRFVNAGTSWQPKFQVSGATPSSCRLTVDLPPGSDPSYEEYVATVDADGVCAFSVGGFNEYPMTRWWSVLFEDESGDAGFGGLVEAILPSTPPTIPDPTLGTTGTSFAANPGAGQGMSLEVSVAPQAVSGAAATSSAPAAICSGTSWSPTFDTGGNLSSAVARCGYVPGTYVVTARMVDAAGVVRTRTRTITLAPDAKKPTTSAPSVRFRTGITLTGSSVPVKVTWTGADTGGAGVGRYELGRSTNGGSTWSLVSSSLTSASFDAVLPSIGTVRYRVRAVDRAGNVGAWVTGPNLSPRLPQETAAGTSFGSGWTPASSGVFSAGAVKYATAAGASASYTFTGRAIALVTTRAPLRGKVKVYVDGAYVTTIDNYASTASYRSVVWQRSWASAGTHTVRVVVVGTIGRPRFDFDALARL